METGPTDTLASPGYGVPDDENPEMTEADFARARPFAEVFPEIAAAARNKGGRPKLDQPTVKVGWRLPLDLVTALRGTGQGYTERIEALLRKALAEGRL